MVLASNSGSAVTFLEIWAGQAPQDTLELAYL